MNVTLFELILETKTRAGKYTGGQTKPRKPLNE